MHKNKSNVMGYSTIEGVIRQTMDSKIKTTKLTFEVPTNGGFTYKFYECADQIADLLDMYFDTQIEDMSRITDLIDDEIKIAMDRQFRENQLENINGGSK